MTPTSTRHDWRTPTVVLVATGLILMLSMGIRHGFGLFLQPMSSDHGWGRETFALAIAVQNLMWGLATPFAGMFADRFGSHRVAFVCGLLYVAGLATMAYATSPLTVRADRRRPDRQPASPASRFRSSPACWGASTRRRSAAWRSASPRPPDPSASSRCCR